MCLSQPGPNLEWANQFSRQNSLVIIKQFSNVWIPCIISDVFYKVEDFNKSRTPITSKENLGQEKHLSYLRCDLT